MPKQPRVTTRTGDDGRTSLWGQARVPKHDARIALLGDLDEAQSAMGLARALARPAIGRDVLALQRAIYELMAEVGTSPEKEPPFRVDDAKIAALEADMARWRERAPISAAFVVPGGDAAAAALDLARTVVRRAERTTARLLDDGRLTSRDVLRYLNRLSDALFVLARLQEGGRTTRARPGPRRPRASPGRR